jgi:ElaB/YqjD/DUF883 family membrane-anchored ribosome-binding protein
MTTAIKSETEETPDMESFKEELAMLRSDVASIVTTLGEISESKVVEVTDSITESLQENTNRDDMKSQLEQARAQGKQLSQDLSEEITRHPLASIAIAFGIGYITSKIVK